jgi:hypothetical protein
MAPTDTISQEIRSAFEEDETRIGDVWRGLKSGKSAEAIASTFNNQSTGFVNKYKRFIRAIETGDLPSAPTMIRECKATTQGFLNRHYERFSPETITILEGRISALEKLRIDPEAEESEDLTIQKRTQTAEKQGVAGIYVYTLPHYRKHPVEPAPSGDSADRTLMKVGMSDSDVVQRFNRQQRNTALPEDPDLLRIYVGDGDMLQVEQRFHRLLRAADHRQNSGRQSGTEWFLTSLKFLDAIAIDLGMSVLYAVDDAISDEE